MHFVKKIIKTTNLYQMFQRYRVKETFAGWTAHDQEMLEFYSNFISRGALCFDVGANIGNRVKCFLELQATVVAIEPQAECVKTLEAVYGGNRNLKIVPKALGEFEGEAEMLLSNVNTISSLSPKWIESVKKSGRFSRYRWDKKQMVAITTLDKIIEQYGIPAFIKIDVEGFEHQVIKGLSRAVQTLSFEYVPEFIEPAFMCIDHLQRLGDIRLNYTVGEVMRLALESWVMPQEMVRILSGFKDDTSLFGDVYVQFVG